MHEDHDMTIGTAWGEHKCLEKGHYVVVSVLTREIYVLTPAEFTDSDYIATQASFTVEYAMALLQVNLFAKEKEDVEEPKKDAEEEARGSLLVPKKKARLPAADAQR